jgi:hypothetical protein
MLTEKESLTAHLQLIAPTSKQNEMKNALSRSYRRPK